MITNAINTKLFEKIKNTVTDSYTLLNQNSALRQMDKLQLQITLHRSEQQISAMQSFDDALNEMKMDVKIKSLQGKLVGDYKGLSLVESEEKCLLAFIKMLYIENDSISDNDFDKEYSRFESFFYDDDLEYEDSVALYNFESDLAEITIRINELTFKKTILPQKTDLEFNKLPGYDIFSTSPFLILRQYSQKKIIKDNTDNGFPETPPVTSKGIFDSLIWSLRILKGSGVYRDNKITSKLITFHSTGGDRTTAPFHENIVIGEKCKIGENDISELSEIYSFIINEKNKRFGIALRRLSSSMERKEDADKLIDSMIGLEALYLPDGNTELSFRLSLRVAYLLETEPTQRKSTFEFMRKIYKVRNKIAHGDEYNLSVEDINKIEELLRKSIKLWIKDENNFKSNKYSNSGKLQKEGKLDTLFF